MVHKLCRCEQGLAQFLNPLICWPCILQSDGTVLLRFTNNCVVQFISDLVRYKLNGLLGRPLHYIVVGKAKANCSEIVPSEQNMCEALKFLQWFPSLAVHTVQQRLLVFNRASSNTRQAASVGKKAAILTPKHLFVDAVLNLPLHTRFPITFHPYQ